MLPPSSNHHILITTDGFRHFSGLRFGGQQPKELSLENKHQHSIQFLKALQTSTVVPWCVRRGCIQVRSFQTQEETLTRSILGTEKGSKD